MKGFRQTTRPELALKTFLDHAVARQLGSERVPLDQALGRVLAHDIVSDFDIPAFDRAAMDGYAVVAQDTFGSSQTNPALLRGVGKAAMGLAPSLKIARGEGAEIATGAFLPAGADAVVMLEYAHRINPDQVEVLSPVTPGENVSKAGEDVQKGDVVLRRGTQLLPPDIGMLAALANREVEVVRRPTVAILCTGSELVELGDSPREGQVINSNRYVLCSLVEKTGGAAAYLGIAKDSLADISRMIRKGLVEADMVLVTGGTSVGETDLVPEAIQTIGEPGMLVHGVAIRPGMPTGLALVNGKAVVSLSGQPVAAMIGFETFVRPLILRLLGTDEQPAPSVGARLSRRVASALGMRTFVRVIVREVDGEYVADPITTTGSGLLSSLTKANGMVIIPEDLEGIEAGDEVSVTMFRPVERSKNG